MSLCIRNHCADLSSSPATLDLFSNLTIHPSCLNTMKHTRPSWLSERMWRTALCGDHYEPPFRTLLFLVFQVDTRKIMLFEVEEGSQAGVVWLCREPCLSSSIATKPSVAFIRVLTNWRHPWALPRPHSSVTHFALILGPESLPPSTVLLHHPADSQAIPQPH